MIIISMGMVIESLIEKNVKTSRYAYLVTLQADSDLFNLSVEAIYKDTVYWLILLLYWLILSLYWLILLPYWVIPTYINYGSTHAHMHTQDFVDPVGNFSNYRSHLEKAISEVNQTRGDKPKRWVVPFFSLIVKDIYFLQQSSDK